MECKSFKDPVLLDEIRKQYKGNFKPVFGRGTGAGRMCCPECYGYVGELMNVKVVLEEDETVKSWVVGEIRLAHPIYSRINDFGEIVPLCKYSGKKVDYSAVTIGDLSQNVIPGEYFEQKQLWDKICALDEASVKSEGNPVL
jgi:hypothetical protein